MTEQRQTRGRPPGTTGRALLEVARSVFLEKGYAGATVEEVARRARISKASLYREHPSKSALYAAVVSDWADAGRDAMRPALERLLDRDDVREGLIELGSTIRAGILSPSVLAMRRLVTSEAEAHPEVADRYLRESWMRNIDDLAAAFTQLDSRGRLRLRDARLAADEFTWLVVGSALNAALLTGSIAADPSGLTSAIDLFLARYAAEHDG